MVKALHSRGRGRERPAVCLGAEQTLGPLSWGSGGGCWPDGEQWGSGGRDSRAQLSASSSHTPTQLPGLPGKNTGDLLRPGEAQPPLPPRHRTSEGSPGAEQGTAFLRARCCRNPLSLGP